MFIEENKRVANLIANKEMIRCGQGIIAVLVEKIGEYINYYETGKYKKIGFMIIVLME